MDRIVIAVGSTRGPKVRGVTAALDTIRPNLSPNSEIEIVGVEVESGVRHTPLSREDLMAGARARAEALVRIAREKSEAWDYFVGLEGGLDIVWEGKQRWVLLENWAYVADRPGRGAFGQSGGVLLPDELARRVVDEGVELAEAIDEFAGGQGIRDGAGAWGVLTCGHITRQEAFRVAVVNAFAPFYNRNLYSKTVLKQRA